MIQDPGPKTNLGFGLPIVHGEPDPEAPQTGIPTNSGVVARAIGDKPLLKFAAVAVASLTSMHVAGKIARSGGFKFAEFAQTYAATGKTYSKQVDEGIDAVRRIQDTLDEYQGVRRLRVDPTDDGRFQFVRRGDDGEWVSDSVIQIDSAGQRATAQTFDSSVPDWQMRDEIQQRLVRQARRLPYELPGFYAADKLVIDPLLGGQEEQRKVNWANPFDAVGDFAWETVKLTAFNVVPFDVAVGSGKHTLNRMRKAMSSPAGPDGTSTGILTTQVLLEQLGVKLQDITEKTIRSSQQTTGAFSMAIEAASQERRRLADVARGLRGEISAGKGARGLSQAAKKDHIQFNIDNIKKNYRDPVLDAMPGPFSGMATGFKTFKNSFKQIGETYDDWQDVVSGRKVIGQLSEARKARLSSYMVAGGGGQIETMALQLQKLGIKAPQNSDQVASGTWGGSLATAVKDEHYKDKLRKNLVKIARVSEEDATSFIAHAGRISAPKNKGKNASHDMLDRIRYSKKVHQTSDAQDWFSKLTADTAEGNLKSFANVDKNRFERAIAITDQSYWSKHEQSIIDDTIRNYHAQITDKVAPQVLGQNIASRKVDFLSLKENLAYNDNFLVRNTAKAMGIKPYGADGVPYDLGTLKNAIIDRGLDATDKKRLLGYLVDKKVVKGPFEGGGLKQALGFKAVSAKEALNSGYYSGYDGEIQNQIRGLLSKVAPSHVGPVNQNNKQIAESGLSAMNIPGVYRGVSGNVIDVGRIKRSVLGGIDAIASETKIPILNLNPAQLAFYNSWMSVRRAAPLQFASQNSQQLAKKRGWADDSNGLFIFARTKGSKGKLFSSRVGMYGESVDLTQIPGEFKPFLTNRLSMTGRMSELLLDSPAIPSAQNQTGWRKLFDVPPDQESNMFFGRESLLGRVSAALRGKDASRANPRRAARLFGEPDFRASDLDTYTSEALDAMQKDLKGYGFQNRVMAHLRKKGVIGGNALHERILDGAPDNMVPRLAREILDEDIASVTRTPEQKIAIRSAQGPILSLFKQADEQSGFWNLPAPAGIKTTGVSRRLDQLKSELSEYMVLRQGIEDTANTLAEPFAYKTVSILREVDELHLAGKISGAEKAEVRASVLSLQLQFSRSQIAVRQASSSATRDSFARMATNQAVLDDALGSSPVVRDLFREYGEYQTEHQGLAGAVTRKIRSKFAPAAYRGPMEIDPIGSSYTFVPTVATGFKDRPLKTLKGLFGGTWSDADSVTSGTIYPAHLTTRINKYFESIGLGLNRHRYKGPMDFYAKGLIGKRVLPAFAAGTSLIAADRTLGGLVNDRDEQGNRVYSPLLIGGAARGVVEGQSLLAGAIPGGQTYGEKKEEMLSGEVPIRQGRYWLLNSNTPFKGGRIEYFRPSWYRRLKAGGEYTPEMKQTPMERLAFGYDFSPLRPLDPYRFERENYSTRPYPLSGDYFTGPFGPMTSVLNNTVGRVLKPTMKMHQTETAAALASYAPLGQSGAVSMGAVSQTLTGINASYAALAGTPGTSSTTPFYGANGYSYGPGTGSAMSVAAGNSVASMYSSVASGENRYPGVYAPMLSQGLGGVGTSSFGAQVVPATAAGRNSSVGNRLGRTGYELQEMAGIYGFATSTARSGLGIGSQDFTPPEAVLESASRGYSSARSFWNLNLGGAGDLPLPIEGRFASLEFSEIVRRFVPKEQQGIQYINGIPNELGQRHPWLPGTGSMNNLRQGDPYNIPDASIRLPGTGRDRVQPRFGSTPGGQYGPIDIHDMLADLDPFGDNYRQVDQMVDSYARTDYERAKIAQTRAQVEAVGIKNEFTPYKYKYMGPEDLVGEAATHPIRFTANKLFEDLAHRDTFLNSKFLRTRTALEDWERSNVYGATYPSWTTPYQSFIEPVVNRSTQRNPLAAASAAGAIGYLFGATPRAKTMGSLIGGIIGGGASLFGSASEAITGRRWMPRARKKELMLEEQADILAYTHSMVNASRAVQSGDLSAAQQFLQQSTKTMYGANLNATPEQLALSVPKRKREHFRAMMYAPEQEREDILSTAGRLERRLLQASWGMNVERLPDLQTYFEGRELPPEESSFWSPYTDMETIKIKMGQQMGLDMSQMGYYPQQIQEANLINPEYPAIFAESSPRNTRARLNALLRDMGVRGSIEQRPTPFSTGDRFELSIGGR